MEYEDAINLVLHKAPMDWEKTVDKMTMDQRNEARKHLESLAERAGMLAAYVDTRHGSGCGDQGHKDAVKEMNRAGRKIHVKVFGYNAYREMII